MLVDIYLLVSLVFLSCDKICVYIYLMYVFILCFIYKTVSGLNRWVRYFKVHEINLKRCPNMFLDRRALSFGTDW